MNVVSFPLETSSHSPAQVP